MLKIYFNTIFCFFVLGFLLILSGCNRIERSIDSNDTKNEKLDQQFNLFAKMSVVDLKGFRWMNQPQDFKIENNSLKVIPSANSDFFNDPVTGTIHTTAPFLHKDVKGDFVATILAKPNFTSVWNGVALLLYIDDNYWAKFCFENSDATGPSPVSVVTRQVSDDANGVILKNQESLWLKLIRKDDLYAMHWSADGKNYKMTRLFKMPHHETVKIGIEAQCPVGKGVMHEIKYFSLVQRTVADVRKGE